MSDKTKEERASEAENDLAQKMILGEVTPDLVQSYRIVKNCIDSAILKGIYTAGDNALLVRAFDTLRNHINDITKNDKAETETTDTKAVVEEAKETTSTTKPARKKG